MISALTAKISVIVLSTWATSWGWGETWEDIELFKLLSGRGRPRESIAGACEGPTWSGMRWVNLTRNRPQQLIYVQLELAGYGHASPQLLVTIVYIYIHIHCDTFRFISWWQKSVERHSINEVESEVSLTVLIQSPSRASSQDSPGQLERCRSLLNLQNHGISD